MTKGQIKQITTAELQKQLAEKPQLVDVREPAEYQAGHIAAAQNAPLSELATFTPDATKPFYLICQSGRRSQRAANELAHRGYDVTNVQGGMNAWTGETV